MDIHSHNHEVSIVICLALGALHALEPGHGKSAFVAHLLTEKGNFRRPLALALTTAVTHAFSILLISLLVHALLHTAFAFDSDAMIGWMNLVSGMILLGLGGFIFWGLRKRFTAVNPKFELAEASHQGDCSCAVHRAPTPRGDGPQRWKTLIVGFAVGLIPCPSALAALSTALTSLDVSSMILIISMFSLGIFFSLTVVGAVVAKFSGRVLALSRGEAGPAYASYLQIAVFVATGLWHISLFRP